MTDDQMPDEVWLNTYDAGPDNGPAKMQTDVYTPESVILPGSAVHYIRADLYEQTEAERDMYKAGMEQHAVYLAAAHRELVKVDAKRDRLRAALERLMRGEGGVNSLEQERIAQEALDHG